MTIVNFMYPCSIFYSTKIHKYIQNNNSGSTPIYSNKKSQIHSQFETSHLLHPSSAQRHHNNNKRYQQYSQSPEAFNQSLMNLNLTMVSSQTPNDSFLNRSGHEEIVKNIGNINRMIEHNGLTEVLGKVVLSRPGSEHGSDGEEVGPGNKGTGGWGKKEVREEIKISGIGMQSRMFDSGIAKGKNSQLKNSMFASSLQSTSVVCLDNVFLDLICLKNFVYNRDIYVYASLNL